MAEILVIDDERLVRAMIGETGTRLGHTVHLAENLAQGLALARQGVDLILLDVMLPDGNGLEIMGELIALPSKPDVVVITGYPQVDGVDKALKNGAFDYIAKPLQVKDIERVICHALQWKEQRSKRADKLNCPEIVGKSRELREALGKLAEAAASDSNVLIVGETGVGKELFARGAHQNSARADGPFITLDCASIPASLLAAHLFGHDKGAFTGADRGRPGLLLLADKGTLFMDEVGELSLEAQGAFLRALDVRRFRPVGSKIEISSDFRLVAATNRDLAAQVRRGEFRGDLLFRLQGVLIQVPALRERIDDIPLILAAYLAELGKADRQTKIVSPDFMRALLDYTWPGNVRELLHVVRGATISAGTSPELFLHHLPREIRIAVSQLRLGASSVHDTGRDWAKAQVGATPAQVFSQPAGKELNFPSLFAAEFPSLKRCKEEAEAIYLTRLLEVSGGDMPGAAKLAGVSRGYLYELLRKHGKVPPSGKAD